MKQQVKQRDAQTSDKYYKGCVEKCVVLFFLFSFFIFLKSVYCFFPANTEYVINIAVTFRVWCIGN